MDLFLKRACIYLITILLAISFFKINGFFSVKKSEIIKSDGLGYYSYLPAIFIYGDYSQQFVQEKFPRYYKGTGIPEYMQIVDNKPVDKYFFGTAVLMYPFFMTAHWLAFYFKQPADGYSILYQYLIGLSAVFYVFIGIYFCERLLRLFHATTLQSVFICFLLVFGTNLFFYATVEPTMSHAFSFAAIAAFLYFSKNIFENGKSKHIIPAFVSLGFVILIRPFNVFIVLALPFLAGSFGKFIEGLKFIFRHYVLTLGGSLLAFCIVALQFIIWYKQTGHFIVYSYTYERFYFDKPHVIKVLFSYQKGFFLYAPLFFLSMTGLSFLFRNNRFMALSFLLFFLLLVYVMSCWHQWYYGSSFGFRPMIEYFPLLAVILLFALNTFKKGRSKFIFITLCLFTLFVNQVQAYQYRKFILHWDLMSRFKYWKVFLKTDSKWNGYVWHNPEPQDLLGPQVERFTSDFEQPDNYWNNSALIDIGGKAHSGKMVAALDKNIEFSNTMTLYNNDKIFKTRNPAIKVMGYIHINNFFASDKLQFVISYDKKGGGTYFYRSRVVENYYYDSGGWKRFEIAMRLDKPESADDIIKIYFWNPEKKSYWVDDVSISFIDVKL